MTDEFLYNGETEVLIQTFAEETSKIPLIVDGKTFYASLVWDFIYRYGLKSEFLANFLGVSEEALLGAIREFVEEVKAKIEKKLTPDEMRFASIRRTYLVNPSSENPYTTEELVDGNWQKYETSSKTSESD